jgi:HD-GYP domain-containing protein (c-di-GMP phosphodiesterase class II)
LTVDAALALLRHGRGTQFDPDVLGAFLDTLARSAVEVLV